MNGPFRLGGGGRIDRARTLSFTFDGRRRTGHPGDTLASALLAEGVRLFARSFKYHRPRGVVGAGADEPNAIVQLGQGSATEPNLRATEVELYDGLVARSVNRGPHLRLDPGAAAGLLPGLLVAGFYYKTFMWPQAFWRRLYEPAIRRMAGLGRAPGEPDPDIYDHRHAHCDVLVVGAGPAGLAAAQAASRAGARVILADERPAPGGTLLDMPEPVGGEGPEAWVEGVLAGLDATVLRRTTAFGHYDQNFVALLQRCRDGAAPEAGRIRQRLWHVRARRVVLATGAHERPLPFPGNDRPGVMLAGAARAYMHRYGVAAGGRVVLFAGDDSAYAAARDLAAHGIGIAALVDVRPGRNDDGDGYPVLAGHSITRVFGRFGVNAVEVTPLGGGASRRIACDCVAVAGGWTPAVHLLGQAGGRLRWDNPLQAFRPGSAALPILAAGSADGRFDTEDCVVQGADAGARAARGSDHGTGFSAPLSPDGAVSGRRPSAPIRPYGGTGKAFVDFQNDVTVDDVALAAREGMRSVEHMKRWTTLGMATDQGKTSNVNGLALLAGLLDRPVPEVGHTTFRPPYTPVAFGALAGRNVGALADPVRRTPMQEWHKSNGAVFEPVGQWLRPHHYPAPGEDMRGAVARECRAVREHAGILDASTLGKIDIRGADAAGMLDWVYTNDWGSLAVGRCRYGLMLGEDGMVFDDGVTARVGGDRYLMTTTTGNAAAVLEWLEEWHQTEWPHLRVHFTPVTEQWATVTLSGPKSRGLLAPLTEGIDLGPGAFPFLALREGRVAGVPARILRVAYSGELTYEINVPWSRAMEVWEPLAGAGAVPYGIEAMHVLRAEKGFIAVGHETDGTVTPLDLGMGWMLSGRKDFIGRRSLARSGMRRSDRPQLVGLLPEDPAVVLEEGAQLIAPGDGDRRSAQVPMLGHVSSAYWSAAMGRGFALAMVKGGRARHGEMLVASATTGESRVRIVDPVFHDREGRRRDG